IESIADARQNGRAAATHTTLPVRPPERAASDIAVVGMAVRCAGADSLDGLWQLLGDARVAVRPVPNHRPCFTRPLEDARSHWAGLLDDVDAFDAGFFGIAPREAQLMDPQLRLFMQVVWAALEDANAVINGIEPETGVFAGV